MNSPRGRKDDWIAIKAEADASINGFAEAIRSGEPATGQVAMDLAAPQGLSQNVVRDCRAA